jgi:hypothetical protein
VSRSTVVHTLAAPSEAGYQQTPDRTNTSAPTGSVTGAAPQASVMAGSP